MLKDLHCELFPAHTRAPLKYVIVCSRYQGQWLLSKHRQRDTWETQGGHIEPGETPQDAAARELYEESGVTDASLFYVCDYLGTNGDRWSNGAVFFADVHVLGEMPRSEMEATRLFTSLPENLTYPLVTPVVIQKCCKFMRFQPDSSETSHPRG